MAPPVHGPSGTSAYSLFLTLAVVALSLWSLDSGLVEQKSLTPPGEDSTATDLPPGDRQPDSRSHLRAASVEDLAFGSWGVIPATAENQEARRKATVALMVYATADGIRR